MIERIATEQRAELEQEIQDLIAEAEQVAEEAWELAGDVPFRRRPGARRSLHGLAQDAPATRRMRQPRGP